MVPFRVVEHSPPLRSNAGTESAGMRGMVPVGSGSFECPFYLDGASNNDACRMEPRCVSASIVPISDPGIGREKRNPCP